MNSEFADRSNDGTAETQTVPILNKSTIKDIDGDDLWKFLGRFGRYQKWQTLLVFLISTNISFPILNGLFVGKNVDFACSDAVSNIKIPPNATLELSECSKKIIEIHSSQLLSETECTDYQFEGNGTFNSYVAEWKLVCGEETLGNLAQTFTMVGMAVGASTLPHFGDRFGRKKLMVGSLVSVSAVGIAMAFVKQFELFVILKFLSGVLNQGFMVPVNVFMLEILPTEMRSVASLLSTTFWVISSILNGIIGYFMRDYDWRTMQIVYGSVSISSLLFLCFLDESLRWLLGNAKVSEAEAIMKKACRMNNKDYQKLLEHVLSSKTENGVGKPGSRHALISPQNKQDSQTQTRNYASDSSKILTLLKNKNMRMISLVMCYTWMISSLTYYGLILLSTSLAGKPYVNFFIIAISEWPAGLLMVICIQRFGRKLTVLMFQLISGISLITAVLIASVAPSGNVYSILQTSFIMIGKFCASGSFNGVWIYTPELYPTNLRNVGIGLASASARIGATFSPFFTILARKVLWAPGALFAGGCFISVFLLTLVPETRWRELPRDVAEVDSWIHDDKKKKRDKNNIIPNDNI